jgi:hypothetical protein
MREFLADARPARKFAEEPRSSERRAGRLSWARKRKGIPTRARVEVRRQNIIRSAALAGTVGPIVLGAPYTRGACWSTEETNPPDLHRSQAATLLDLLPPAARIPTRVITEMALAVAL